MTRTLVISHRAETDLVGIWRWTCDKFGQTQADRYLAQLADRMKTCGTAPEGGKDRSSLRGGYRSVLVGRHVVFYTFTDTQVVIQRVLHGNMDFDMHMRQ